MLLIGSRAMDLQMIIKDRVKIGTDFDLIMSPDELNKWAIENEENILELFPRSNGKYKAIVKINNLEINKIQYEIEVAHRDSSAELLINILSNNLKFIRGPLNELIKVVPLEYLLLTKRSHLMYPIHFEKNISDYHLMKNYLGEFQITPKMKQYYELRLRETVRRVKQRTPNLNVTTEDFFSSTLAVPNYFVHDDIHKTMSIDGVPMYEKMQPDKNLAWCFKDMFFNMSYEDQVRCVQEEAYAISLERYIIPQYGKIDFTDYHTCYLAALKRICTTLTSGWFRDFAIENYNEAVKRYDYSYVFKFIHKALTKEIVPNEGYELKDIPLFKKVVD